jgi:hypothetical protein
MALEEFKHFFQEAYPSDLKKAQVEKDAIKKSGDMTIIKKIVRACTDNNGHTHLPKISKGNFNRLGVPAHIKKMNPDEYQMAYDYIKPILDELRDPQHFHTDCFRSLKKKLFDLTGVGKPESHVITIIDKPPGSVSFNIIQKKQNRLYKRTNKTKFVHFSNANNLSTLYPTSESKVFNGHKYLYPNFRCYFWAIEDESIPKYMIDYASEVYGKHIYQYTPKTSDKIVIDMSESKRFPGCTPVFIETDKPLSVKDITNDIDISNNNDVSHNVDNDAKGVTTSTKQSIIQDENRKVLEEFKSIEYAVMHHMNNFIHMKESTKNADNYRKLYNKIEENIEFDLGLITSKKTKCSEHYPNAKNINLFDDLLKRYTKKVNAILAELKNLIKKSNVVKESYYGPNDDDTSGTSEFDEPYDNDPDDCYCESSIFDDEDTDTEYDWLATKLDNEVSFWLEKCYNLWTSVPDIVYSSDSFGVDIIDYLPDDWELAVTTPDIWKDLIDQTIRCSNAILYTIDEFDKLDPEQKMKHEGVKFDHNELIEYINQIIQLANNVKSSSIFSILDSQHVMTAEEKAQVNDVYEVGNLFKAIAKDWVSKYKPNRLRYFQESSIPRSNEVYTNGGSIEKINNLQFDKVYFGSPNKLSTTMKLDGPLFVSPYPGIASIFSVRPQNLSKYGVQRGQRVNRDYDEWNRSLIDTVLQKPLRELHVRLQGDGLNIKPTTELVSGYLYTIDVTPEIKDHIYQSSKMSKVFEFCIDKIDSITFSDIKKINVRMTVTGGNRPVQEAYDAITGEEIPIDHAYTMDEMKERTYTEEELMNTIQEAKLPSKKRNKLPDSDFALVYTDANGKKIRKYPIHDEAHCKAAAHMFPRGVPLKYKAEVARKILRRAHKFGIDTSGWKNLNKFK